MNPSYGISIRTLNTASTVKAASTYSAYSIRYIFQLGEFSAVLHT